MDLVDHFCAVSVGAGYSPPNARDDLASTFKHQPITLDVLINDYDPRGGNLTLVGLGSLPRNGTAKIVSRSQIKYESIGFFSGIDSFSYIVSNGFLTANATVKVTVVNRPPKAVPIYTVVSKNAKRQLIDFFSWVGDNDEKIYDIDKDDLSIVKIADQHIVGDQNNLNIGNIEIEANTGVYYTPVSGFNGVEQFNYTISDGIDTDTSTVTIKVSLFLFNHIYFLRLLTIHQMPLMTRM